MGQTFWERIILKRRSWRSLLLQISIAAAGLATATVVFVTTQIYPGATTFLAVILIALCGEVIPALVLSIGMGLAADYFFIPPIGHLFDSREGIEHFLLLGIVSVAVNLLAQSLRSAFKKAIFARGEAEDSIQAMEQMLALVSHDVRNPLASVRLMAELLQRNRDRPERAQEIGLRMMDTLGRVDRMIQTLLDVSRVKAGQPMPLLFERCDLSALVTQIGGDLGAVWGSRVTVQTEKPVWGTWSPDGIRRALENLITNAVKYGDPKTAIEIGVTATVSQKGGEAALSVRNFGPVIPPSEHEKLFAFYQRGSTGQRSKGWGLGLALVKAIAVGHEGTVTVSSGPLTGTTFTLHLPIRTFVRQKERKPAERSI